MKTTLVISAAVLSIILFVAFRRTTNDRQIVFNPPTTPARPIPDDEFPFDHPAAGRAPELFLALNVTSEDVYRALPLRERYPVDVTAFEAEVMNGGIDQYMPACQLRHNDVYRHFGR